MPGKELKCGKCGNNEFYKFGPYDSVNVIRSGDPKPGLKWIYTCTKCGNQAREYNDGMVVDCFTKEERKSKLMALPLRYRIEM